MTTNHRASDTYAKGVESRATVGEAQQIAMRSTIPAFIAARFALVLSLLSLVLSAIAIALALRA